MEKFLDIVRQSDGVDTVVMSFPIDEKDTVRLHTPDDFHIRAVIRHPRTAYDKIEREGLTGQGETVLVPGGEDANSENAVASVPMADDEGRLTRSSGKKRVVKKSTAKKSTAKK